ncbi:MAG: hypothetical protein A2Y10_16885 [Planctomycetes bacterium GWF2_41_51]|nr:MAG: hypothetical protein A2Y10_16885 [Planctomycetes bacterium GWF2_41_51]HBG28094.1 hypothetical protein [Phycisphaerales bacterium]
MKKQKNKLKGFTLVELLVVISIIAVLLAVLMPALNKARDNAKRVICNSNLHQWGIVMKLYDTDNKGLFGPFYGWGPPAGPYPCAAWIPSKTGVDGQFRVDLVSKYIPGFKWNPSKPLDSEFGDIWRCPANFMTMKGLNQTHIPNGYMTLQYSYYGRADTWDKKAPVNAWNNYESRISAAHLKKATERQLTGTRVIMADSCYFWNSAWSYNHGKKGASIHDGASTSNFVDKGGLGIGPMITGINVLYGDGHTIWKGRGTGENQMNPRIMNFIDCGPSARDERSHDRQPHVHGARQGQELCFF